MRWSWTIRLSSRSRHEVLSADLTRKPFSLEKLLHRDFVWVHDHAGTIQESRAALIDPMRWRPPNSAARRQEDLSVVIFENTAIVYGYANVERTEDYVSRTGNPRPVKYHFVRTYVGRGDQGIRLLGNHTMEVWREGQDS